MLAVVSRVAIYHSGTFKLHVAIVKNHCSPFNDTHIRSADTAGLFTNYSRDGNNILSLYSDLMRTARTSHFAECKMALATDPSKISIPL